MPGTGRAERCLNSIPDKALARAMLASGQLGSHNGLPVTLIVSTTLKELESGRGHAVTAGGSLLPMAEVIRQAAAAHHYSVVFDDHTECPLYRPGRHRHERRSASPLPGTWSFELLVLATAG